MKTEPEVYERDGKFYVLIHVDSQTAVEREVPSPKIDKREKRRGNDAETNP